jgi:hypothetical protein
MWTLPLGGDDIKQKPSAAAFLIPRAITRPSLAGLLRFAGAMGICTKPLSRQVLPEAFGVVWRYL